MMKRRWWQIWRWCSWWRWRSHQQGARQKGCRGMLPPVEVGRCAKNFQLSIVKFQCASKFQLFWQTETESVEHFGFLSNLWSIVDAKVSWQWMQRKEVLQLSLRIARSCFDFCIRYFCFETFHIGYFCFCIRYFCFESYRPTWERMPWTGPYFVFTCVIIFRTIGKVDVEEIRLNNARPVWGRSCGQE